MFRIINKLTFLKSRKKLHIQQTRIYPQNYIQRNIKTLTYSEVHVYILCTVRIPDEVDFFNLPNPSSRTMAPGSTQPLTEMSTRNLHGG
jgi:hypothetical protein